MDFNTTGILILIMLIFWQFIMWKNIKLKKWQNLSLGVIMIGLGGWLIYLTFIMYVNFYFLFLSGIEYVNV